MDFKIFVNFNPFLSFDDLTAGSGERSAEIIESKIVELMRQPKTGEPYKHKDGSMRPASAVGEAPGIDSMDLIGSFDVIALSAHSGQIYSDIDYGNILQEKRGRPFTEPAIELAMPEIVDLIEEQIVDQWR